jgi:hypothetical protein
MARTQGGGQAQRAGGWWVSCGRSAAPAKRSPQQAQQPPRGKSEDKVTQARSRRQAAKGAGAESPQGRDKPPAQARCRQTRHSRCTPKADRPQPLVHDIDYKDVIPFFMIDAITKHNSTTLISVLGNIDDVPN